MAWSSHKRTENSNQKENSFKSKNVGKQNKTLINQHEEKSIYSKQEIVGEQNIWDWKIVGSLPYFINYFVKMIMMKRWQDVFIFHNQVLWGKFPKFWFLYWKLFYKKIPEILWNLFRFFWEILISFSYEFASLFFFLPISSLSKKINIFPWHVNP